MKPRLCEHCGKEFEPQRMGQRVCRAVCASKLVRAEKKAETVRTRERKAALKTIPDLIKEAQREFNAFIRQRDAQLACISCGSPPGVVAVGGGVDAGHYRSTGSASHLRFHEDNCHAQCKQCNRYGAGRAVDYRIGLIQRIGLERVEALESANASRKWTRDELESIKLHYRAELRRLKEKVE